MDYHIYVYATRHLSVTLNTTSVYSLQDDFLSVAIKHNALVDNMFNFQSKKLKNLMLALSPANMRVGGTRADLTVFNPNDSSYLMLDTIEEWKKRFERDSFFDVEVLIHWQNENLTTQTWDAYMRFMRSINWTVQYGLNYALQKDGQYDPYYSSKFLTYNQNVLGIQVDAVELVNEPNSLGYKWGDRLKVSPEQLVNETRRLKEAMIKENFGDVKISGPDVSGVGMRKYPARFLEKFLKGGGTDLVDLITVHHYNLNGRTATLENMTDVSNLDMVIAMLKTARQIMQTVGATQPLVLSETACCWGVGSEDFGFTFVSGFMFLDLLGLSAKYGVRRVNRQTLLGSWYALLQPQSYQPTPDYWVAVLHKRLVGGPVLETDIHPEELGFRMYANCAKRDYYKFPVGSVVFYFLNVKDEIYILESPLFYKGVQLFILTPDGTEGLQSEIASLNNKPIKMADDELPTLSGKYHTGPVPIPAESYGFIVATSVNLKECGGSEVLTTADEKQKAGDGKQETVAETERNDNKTKKVSGFDRSCAQSLLGNWILVVMFLSLVILRNQ